MNRRSFTQTLLGSGMVYGIGAQSNMKKSRYLRAGDQVGLICPAGPISDERLVRSISNLLNLGLKPIPGNYILNQNGYLAGTRAERLADLHQMYRDEKIRAVWCIRGGFGCTHLLPHLDYDLIQKSNKPLLGYSDVTALHCGLYTRLKSSNLHSPVASSEFTPYTLEHLQKIIFGSSGQVIHIGYSPENDQLFKEGNTVYERYVIREGTGRGVLWGGNLSLLSALSGTPYLKINRDFLLFVEDIEEVPYRIDRMLTQLLQVLPLHRLKGVILGVFEGCERKANTPSQSLKEVMLDLFSGFEVPVLYGFPFGHIKNQCTLPFGAEAVMDTGSFRLTVKLP